MAAKTTTFVNVEWIVRLFIFIGGGISIEFILWCGWWKRAELCILAWASSEKSEREKASQKRRPLLISRYSTFFYVFAIKCMLISFVATQFLLPGIWAVLYSESRVDSRIIYNFAFLTRLVRSTLSQPRWREEFERQTRFDVFGYIIHFQIC